MCVRTHGGVMSSSVTFFTPLSHIGMWLLVPPCYRRFGTLSGSVIHTGPGKQRQSKPSQTPRCPGSQALGALCWPWEARPGYQPRETSSSTSLSLRSNSSLPLHNPSSFLQPTLQAYYPHPSLSATSLLVQATALSSLGSCYSLFTMYRPLSQSLLPEQGHNSCLCCPLP